MALKSRTSLLLWRLTRFGWQLVSGDATATPRDDIGGASTSRAKDNDCFLHSISGQHDLKTMKDYTDDQDRN